MARIAVVGSSGVGTSTFADTLGAVRDLPVIELDALMHGPDWTPTPTPEFRSEVSAAIGRAEGADSAGGWIVAGNYRTVSDIVQGRADTIVWLDLPRRVSMFRLLRRSLRRAITREEVWGGNRESLGDLVSRDPSRNVVLWAWQHHGQYTQMYETYADGGMWSHATVHRLRSAEDVAEFVAGHTS